MKNPRKKVVRAWAIISPTSGRMIETYGKPWIAMRKSDFDGQILPGWFKYAVSCTITYTPKKARGK